MSTIKAAPPLPKERPKDTYAMAFKAMNLTVTKELDLERDEILNAF